MCYLHVHSSASSVPDVRTSSISYNSRGLSLTFCFPDNNASTSYSTKSSEELSILLLFILLCMKTVKVWGFFARFLLHAHSEFGLIPPTHCLLFESGRGQPSRRQAVVLWNHCRWSQEQVPTHNRQYRYMIKLSTLPHVRKILISILTTPQANWSISISQIVFRFRDSRQPHWTLSRVSLVLSHEKQIWSFDSNQLDWHWRVFCEHAFLRVVHPRKSTSTNQGRGRELLWAGNAKGPFGWLLSGLSP